MRSFVLGFTFLSLAITLMVPSEMFAQRGLQKYSLAVLNFATASDILTDGDAQIVTEGLTEEISDAGLFYTMSQKNMERGLQKKNFDPGGCNTIDCAVEAGRALGVQLVVIGSIKESGSLSSIDAKMVHVSSREIVKSQSRDYSGDLGKVYDDLRSFARKLLGLDAARTATKSQRGELVPNRSSEKDLNLDSTIESEPVDRRPYAEPDFKEGRGGGFNWKYVGLGLLVAGGVGAGLLLANGSDSGGSSGGTTTPPPVLGDLPGAPTFP